MANLYLARHGETEYNVRKLYQGVLLEMPLTERGYRDGQHYKEVFRDEHLDAILCSPARRTIDTVTPLAQAKGLEPILDDDLIERDHGNLVGTSYAEMLDVFHYLYHNENKEGGESLETAQARAIKVIDRIRKEFAGKNLFVQSHGMLISLMCGALRGEGVVYRPEHVLETGHFHHYELDDSGRVIKARLNLGKL